MSSTWWHIPALVATIAVLSYALVQLTIEPESVQKKRHAMHLLTEVQAISDSVMAKLTALEHDVQRNGKESEENDVPLNSYYHFDSTGKKLKTKWDTYDVEAELNKLDQDDESNSSSSSATKSSTVKQSPKFTKSQLLSRAGEIEHEFEAVRVNLASTMSLIAV
ncbi:hypothetical protein LEN26_013560 [Aphanomyces euteiches]|nr:hypothetical protein AeMF1_015513 [Aphanomyces euteiches]KAH9111092.1 hypothetical protein LEN26_013560 [Aphanomyces euteiches]KAH9193950.1 hypothetical protein AeNC1_004080 [Aphanomyces euteiches]